MDAVKLTFAHALVFERKAIDDFDGAIRAEGAPRQPYLPVSTFGNAANQLVVRNDGRGFRPVAAGRVSDGANGWAGDFRGHGRRQLNLEISCKLLRRLRRNFLSTPRSRRAESIRYLLKSSPRQANQPRKCSPMALIHRRTAPPSRRFRFLHHFYFSGSHDRPKTLFAPGPEFPFDLASHAVLHQIHLRHVHAEGLATFRGPSFLTALRCTR